MSMAERIHQKRIENDMTMEELANRLNVGKSAVNKWEKGYVTNIKRETIQKMSDIFGCSPAWLMGLDVPIENQKPITGEDILRLAYPGASKEVHDKLLPMAEMFATLADAPEDVQHTIEMILKSVPPKP